MLTTKRKLALARLASKGLVALRRSFGRPVQVTVVRRGVTWALDLTEGIDLAIFLSGRFEASTVAAYRRLLVPGDCVLDIGANIGAHTLPLAQCVGPSGRVVACEPTHFAFDKLQANVALNPDLARRIRLEQVMFVEKPGLPPPPHLFASWSLGNGGARHAIHGGIPKTTAGASSRTVDEYVDQARLAPIKLIKIDVDGDEVAVLTGARRTLARDNPLLVLEIAPYALVEHGTCLEALVETLREAGYVLMDVSGRARFPSEARALRRLIPDGASRNVLARPRSVS